MPDAIVLAGGPPDREHGIPTKAFLEIAGRPMVAHVVEALRRARGVGRIVLLAPPAAVPAPLRARVDAVAQPGETIPDTVEAGLRALDPAGPVLAVGADLPLLTAWAVEAFLERCAAIPAQVWYAVVSKADADAAYPGSEKTYVRLADGTFGGGSVFLFDPAVLARVRPLLRQAAEARKKPWRLARLFGARLVARFALGRLSIADLERRFTELTGVVGRAVVAPPETGIDVDAARPENLRVVRRALETRG